MDAFKQLSEDELDAMMRYKYGKEWNIEDLDDDDELVKEFFRRLSLVEG